MNLRRWFILPYNISNADLIAWRMLFGNAYCGYKQIFITFNQPGLNMSDTLIYLNSDRLKAENPRKLDWRLLNTVSRYLHINA